MALTIDSKVKELMDNPKTAEVVDKYIPGMSTNKKTKMAHGMPLRALCKFPQVGIKPEEVDAMEKDLAALGL